MSFQRLCALSDVPTDVPLAVRLDDLDLAVVTADGEFFALQDECSHAAVALTEGDVEDCSVECWLHGSRFDLRTGKPIGPPATEPVATFPVEIRGADLYVDLTQTLNGVQPS